MVKKVAVKVVKVVDRIFTPRERSNSTGGSWNSSDIVLWNSTAFFLKVAERRRRNMFMKNKKVKSGRVKTECSGPHSFEKLSNDGTAKLCLCDIGYKFNPDNLSAGCLDIDECLKDVNVTQLKRLCGPNSVCINTEGWYTCRCLEGFTGDAIKGCTAVEVAESGPKPETTKPETTPVGKPENPIENEVIAPKPGETVITDG